MEMTVIPWQKAYIKELVSLWNEEFRETFPMRETLFLQNSFDDENVFMQGSGIAVNEEGKVIGFIITKQFQEHIDVEMKDDVAWIQVLVVAKAHRNQGIGTALLVHAETQIRTTGLKSIMLGQDTYHYFPGVPAEQRAAINFFKKHNYIYQGQEVDMYKSYNKETNTTLPELKDVDFSLLKLEEKDAFFTFLKRCFPGRWEYEAIHYFRKGGKGREFILIKKAGRIIGFCRINDALSPLIAQNVYWAPLLREELGGIGPLGVDATERGYGYGFAIVGAGIAFLRQRGIKHIVIDWTGLVDFYGKLGFDIWKTYYTYSKQLDY